MKVWLLTKAMIVATTIIVAIIIGPFGTYEDLALKQRVIYWVVALLGVGFFMEVSIIMALTHPGLTYLGYYQRLTGAVLFAAFPGTIVILALESIFREILPTPAFGTTVWGFVALVGCVMGLIQYRRGAFLPIGPSIENADPVAVDTQAALSNSPTSGELFFRRLDESLGRDLVSLSMQDHYLSVVTRNGTQLVLMRMADAVAELEDYPGVQIHRSHWAKLSEISELKRNGNKWAVILSDGRKLPVSRGLAVKVRKSLEG